MNSNLGDSKYALLSNESHVRYWLNLAAKSQRRGYQRSAKAVLMDEVDYHVCVKLLSRPRLFLPDNSDRCRVVAFIEHFGIN